MHFLLPDPIRSSGGDIYNRKVLEHAPPGVLEPFFVDDRKRESLFDVLAAKHHGWVLWDSLLMPFAAMVRERFPSLRHALLVHYLPSLNPQVAEAEQRRLRALEDEAASVMEAFIATGKGMGFELQSRYGEKPVAVCEPGVDEAFFLVRERRSVLPGRMNLLTVANLVPAKGHPFLLRVLKQLAHLPWHWHLAGNMDVDSSLLEIWADALADSGLADRVHWLGCLSQADLAARMEDMDLFLSASSFEAYGMALAEAATAGLPAVATRTGEAARLIRDGERGFLVAAGDEQAFALRLEQLIQDEPLRLRMALAKPAAIRSWRQASDSFYNACRAVEMLNLRS